MQDALTSARPLVLPAVSPTDYTTSQFGRSNVNSLKRATRREQRQCAAPRHEREQTAGTKPHHASCRPCTTLPRHDARNICGAAARGSQPGCDTGAARAGQRCARSPPEMSGGSRRRPVVADGRPPSPRRAIKLSLLARQLLSFGGGEFGGWRGGIWAGTAPARKGDEWDRRRGSAGGRRRSWSRNLGFVTHWRPPRRSDGEASSTEDGRSPVARHLGLIGGARVAGPARCGCAWYGRARDATSRSPGGRRGRRRRRGRPR